MADRGEQGRWYWHCHECDRYVPREQQRCACGAPKVRGTSKPSKPGPTDRTLAWEAAAILLLVGLSLLWLFLK
jgi:hypothetical protein